MTTAIDVLTDEKQDLLRRFRAVRDGTLKLVEPLSAEDCTTQSMPDASPAKWHLAHTTWFFERLIVEPSVADYQRFDPTFHVLFNSYYNSLGKQHPRPLRGVLSRPSLDHVLGYRHHVDQYMQSVLGGESSIAPEVARTIEVGLNHEQQHQELLLMDIKHLLSCNPLKPVYSNTLRSHRAQTSQLEWTAFPEGLEWIGHDTSRRDFAFDNETPRHRVFTEAFHIANRLTTNREYLAFIGDGGYQRPELWLSDGWAAVQADMWVAPLYWQQDGGVWQEFTLGGQRALDLDAPVCHVSYYEADAFARWSGARLPSEAEWEISSASIVIDGNLVEDDYLRPVGIVGGQHRIEQMFGDVWEWTKSGYESYPGYRTPSGPLGEYNSKFMCGQLVLRGGSCVTPQSHIRTTYRNFFPPHARWQFSGIRLCRDKA